VLDTTTGKEKHLVGGELGCLAPFDLAVAESAR
jgi:hypothetical protein